MKKYLCILAAVLILSVGTLAAGHLWVNSAREKVDIREIVLEGNPAAAAGLSITCHGSDQENHLFWDTTFTPGRTEQAETLFRLSAAGEDKSFSWPDFIRLDQASDEFSISSMDLEQLDQAFPECMIQPVLDVASRTAAGETRTETVRLADYYEFYPLTLDTNSIKYPNNSIFLSSEEMQWLSEYFQVKVDAEETREVTVEKESDGRFASIEMSGSSGDWLQSDGVITEQGIFLIAESVDDSGNPDGRLECRDGPGVHLIRYQEDREDEPVESYLELFEPQLFYPTGSARALRLCISPDERELLLYTQEEGALVLTVLDAATGEVLQRLDLLEEAVSPLNLIETGGLHLAITETDAFSLVSREGGRYAQVLTGTLGLPEEGWMLLRTPYMLAWDGRRMALASANQHYYSGTYSSNGNYCYAAGLWDESGLCFLAGYLWGPGRDPSVLGYQATSDPPSLRFTGK